MTTTTIEYPVTDGHLSALLRVLGPRVEIEFTDGGEDLDPAPGRWLDVVVWSAPAFEWAGVQVITDAGGWDFHLATVDPPADAHRLAHALGVELLVRLPVGDRHRMEALEEREVAAIAAERGLAPDARPEEVYACVWWHFLQVAPREALANVTAADRVVLLDLLVAIGLWATLPERLRMARRCLGMLVEPELYL